jgi:hypothetical protein
MIENVTILDRQLRDAAIPIHGVSENGESFVVDFMDEATEAQRTQAAAIVAAFNPLTAETAHVRTLAKTLLDDPDFRQMLIRAVVLEMLGYSNVQREYEATIRTKHNDLLAWLNDQGTRLINRGLLPGFALPAAPAQATGAQAKAAIKGRLDAGEGD